RPALLPSVPTRRSSDLRDGMSAARGVVEREALHAVALLPESGGRGGPGEARADDQDSVLAPVGGIHQLHLEAAAVPFLFDRSRRDRKSTRLNSSHQIIS